MDVQYETRLSKRRRIQPHERRTGRHPAWRVDAHPVTVLQLTGEVHRLVVQHDHGDLGVRNAQRLGEILDRCAGGHLGRDGSPTMSRREEVVQAIEEPDVDAEEHRGRA